MARRLNVVLLVVDSLRRGSLAGSRALGEVARTPFLDALHERTLEFTRAYASECWTLPAHMSMFTGLLPSRHGAHFQSMSYGGSQPTIAELLSARGYHTEIVTRNSLFDGSVPGVTRGFRKNSRVIASLTGLNPFSIVLAMSKPRFRRQVMTSGFFHPAQRKSREFITEFARATAPADRGALDRVLEVMTASRRDGVPYFVFCNLYDVHAPYPPSESSMFRPFFSRRGLTESVLIPTVMPKLGGHAYLREGFRMSKRGRRMLLERYLDAIALMDEKLRAFYDAARADGLLDDTLLVVTSDHGEGFGEHGLYLHDASLYETHLHVPLFVHHPDGLRGRVDDVVTTRDLFSLFLGAADGRTSETILAESHREQNPVAHAEHFYYPHVPDMRPEFRQNIAAAIGRSTKVIVRREGAFHYDLVRDPGEEALAVAPLTDFVSDCVRTGAAKGAVARGLEELERSCASLQAA